MLTHKCLHDNAPSYLSDFIKYQKSEHNMAKRSSKKNLLDKPSFTKVKSYGKRAFCIAAPTLWNNIDDDDLRQTISLPLFKRKLKTYLFKTAFKDID